MNSSITAGSAIQNLGLPPQKETTNVEESRYKAGLTTPKESTNDSAEKIAVGGIKYDAGKSPLFRGALAYFPRAMAKVAAVSNFGARKYAWGGWRLVDDGYNRYSDAMVRHLAAEATGESVDPDSGLPHAAHCAWGALARLEILLQQEENNDLLEMYRKGSSQAGGVAAPNDSATKPSSMVTSSQVN